MNIAMLQLSKGASLQPTTPASIPATETTTSESNAFGSVFSQVMETSQQTQQTTIETAQSTSLTDVQAVLQTETLEQLLEELGIETDEGMLFALIGEGEEPVAIDQMLNLEDLTAALGLTEEQLTEIVQQFVGEEQPITDVWTLIEQTPAIMSQIISALQGNEQTVTPKEAEKVVQLLKFAELLGKKTDTVYQQEFQLSQLKENLQSALAQVQQVAVQQPTTQQTVTTSFQQVVQQIVQQASVTTTTTSSSQESDTPQVNTSQQQTTVQTKTVTVTLPAERPAQSEALIKEIQNLISRSQLSGQQGNLKLLLKLYPENLGSIRIELIQKDGILTARLLASTAVGKELLDSNLNQLKAGFVAQNIQMERIDIAQSLQDADRNTRDQNLFNNFFRQQAEEQQDESEEDSDEEKLSFSELLNEEV